MADMPAEESYSSTVLNSCVHRKRAKKRTTDTSERVWGGDTEQKPVIMVIFKGQPEQNTPLVHLDAPRSVYLEGSSHQAPGSTMKCAADGYQTASLQL